MSTSVGNYRWTICALVFFATTVNYLDRAVISLLKPILEKEFSWRETDYANIVVMFQVCYALGMIVAGRIIDKLGTKIGYALATGLWSIAAVAHGFVTGTLGFFAVRGALGITEAGNFPAAIKSTAEWFPVKERALATGIFNAGTNIGAIVAPMTVPFIAVAWGWKWAFILTGMVGFVWLIFWFWLYEIPAKHKKLSKTEYDYIHRDVKETPQVNVLIEQKLSWSKLLKYKQTWAFAIGKFLTDPIWWFYLFWLPDFLKKEYSMSVTAVALPVSVAYSMATIGSVFGGYLPLNFMKSGWNTLKARRTSMLIFAFGSVPVLFAQYLGAISPWFAVLVIGLAMSAHQAWSANIFTTVSDMFPKSATASVTGIGGMFGALGGVLISKTAGILFQHYKELGDEKTGYYIMFLICGSTYLLAWIIMRALVPKMEEIR
jgi:ACS family hexuronate transporter-like MFS transporter